MSSMSVVGQSYFIDIPPSRVSQEVLQVVLIRERLHSVSRIAVSVLEAGLCLGGVAAISLVTKDAIPVVVRDVLHQQTDRLRCIPERVFPWVFSLGGAFVGGVCGARVAPHPGCRIGRVLQRSQRALEIGALAGAIIGSTASIIAYL